MNYRSLLSSTLGLGLIFGMLTNTSVAQDNPVPLNYKGLTVNVIEINNNQTRRIQGAKVTVEPVKDVKDQHVKFPQYDTTKSNSGQAHIRPLPPSKQVGQYKVTVETRDCGTQTKKMRMSGTSDKRMNFRFTNCGKRGEIANEFERRRKGGYELIVKLKENGGAQGRGYWVHLKDSQGKLIKKIRTSGSAKASFKAIQPEGPYLIEVYRFANIVKTLEYKMPKEDTIKTVQLN